MFAVDFLTMVRMLLSAREYYVGIVDTQKIGDSLAKVEAKSLA
jgi:hypothetical protein